MVRKPKSAAPGANGVLPKLKAIYDFMTQHSLETLELDEEGLHVRMVRRKAVSSVPAPVPMAAPASLTEAPGGTPERRPAAAPAEALPPGAAAVKSSMMGIFYRAPSPSSPPFVKEGDRVAPGQVLCMIEAMKVFNEIKAEFPCTLLKMLVENGKPVKSGQDLFLVQRT